MGVRNKFEQWMLRKEFNQDTFQSFVCWMLLAGTVASFFTPAYLVLFQNSADHCSEGTFTILSHYRIHSWLYDMFEQFKIQEDSTNKVCFELVISDSQFDESLKPAIWIPENTVWLKEAESDDTIYGESLVSSTSQQCIETSNIPMGLVTWKSFAKYLDNPMEFNDFLRLGRQGWGQFTGGQSSTGSLSFSHAHPNVTSSGVLGLILGYQSQINTSDTFNYFAYTKAEIGELSIDVENVEDEIHELGPNELIGISTQLGHGPDYIHAMYGFENDVAYNMDLYKNTLEALWNDTLEFVYFTESYWMTHPVCVLNDASYLSSKIQTIAEKFQEFITNSTRLEKLLDYGIRPSNTSQTIISNSPVMSSDNGVDTSITTQNTISLDLPNYRTVQEIRNEWQDLKEPVYLRILMETSDAMNEPISGRSSKSRWSRAKDGLENFAKVLENNAVVEVKCFAQSIRECSNTEEYPNGTLEFARDDIVSYIENSMSTTQQTSIALYDAINQTVNDLKLIKEENERGTDENERTYYNYVLLVVSQDESGDSEMSGDELIESVGINYSPDDLHIFPVSFWGTTDGRTAEILEQLATNTNGEFYQTKSDMEDIFEEISYYF